MKKEGGICAMSKQERQAEPLSVDSIVIRYSGEQQEDVVEAVRAFAGETGRQYMSFPQIRATSSSDPLNAIVTVSDYNDPSRELRPGLNIFVTLFPEDMERINRPAFIDEMVRCDNGHLTVDVLQAAIHRKEELMNRRVGLHFDEIPVPACMRKLERNKAHRRIGNPLLNHLLDDHVRDYVKQTADEAGIREYNLRVQLLYGLTRFDVKTLFADNDARTALEKELEGISYSQLAELLMSQGLIINYNLIYSLVDNLARYLRDVYAQYPEIPHRITDVSRHPIFMENSETVLVEKGGNLFIVSGSSREKPLPADYPKLEVELTEIDPQKAARILVAHPTMHPERELRYNYGLRIKGTEIPFSLLALNDIPEGTFKSDLIILAGLDPRRAVEAVKLYQVEKAPTFSASILAKLVNEALRRIRPDLQCVISHSSPNFSVGGIRDALEFIPIGANPGHTYFVYDERYGFIFMPGRRIKQFGINTDDVPQAVLPLLPTFTVIRPIPPWDRIIKVHPSSVPFNKDG